MAGKAGNLRKISDAGFNVPPFFIVNISEELNVASGIDRLLKDFSKDSAAGVSQKIENIIKAAESPRIQLQAGRSKKYAVRSSGAGEDSEEFSFAGQYKTYLNVSAEDVQKRIIDCYASCYGEKSLIYRANNNMPLAGLKMDVIVQEMIDPEISGVAFSVNVLSGNDTEIMYEVCHGPGENLTDGKKEASLYVYDWYKGLEIKNAEEGVSLSQEQKHEITGTVLRLQCLFGYPVDVEFAFSSGVLYVLQARPVTKILFGGLAEQFTTANFKDGGVSAGACNMLMWSLYETVFDGTIKDFYIKTGAFKPKELTKQIRLYFARPYWNVSSAKAANLQYPGFIERNYDAELGLRADYQGQGKKTKITPAFLMTLPRVLKTVFKIMKENESSLEKNKEYLLADYYRLAGVDPDALSSDGLEALYKDFINNRYMKNERHYFWLVFVNTLRLTIYRKKVLKTVTMAEYLNLLSGIKDISHLRPYEKLSELAERIKADSPSYNFWKNTAADEIVKLYKKDPRKYNLTAISGFNDEFGYHSFRELDITFPDFYEDPLYAVNLIKHALDAPEVKSGLSAYEEQKERLKQKAGKRKYKKLIQNTESIRKFLWWREEFKDLSTRYYSLVRKLTLKLADRYVQKGIIETGNDIFHLKYSDIFDYIDQKTGNEELNKKLTINKLYHDSFVNFKNESEIGGVNRSKALNTAASAAIKGAGCGRGTATGRAKIISGADELPSVGAGDIIIARHFDTSFITAFKTAAGIITETGGVLCHSAIIAREFNLPAIVSAAGITQKIKTGDIITMDASTGAITVINPV